MHDVVFISYDEPEAERNWLELKSLVPHAKRVHGITGIANAWKEAARVAGTSHFFSMDADSRLNPGFDWSVPGFSGEDDQRVHVYRCRNAVNGLVYGYGSIHLFNTELVRRFSDVTVADFTLSVAVKGFQIQPAVASTTHFNTSPYIAWKSGFREASKLAGGTNAYVGTQPDPKSYERLKIWCSVGRDVPFGEFCMLGARQGARFGFTHRGDVEKLKIISDHGWFRETFGAVKEENTEALLDRARQDLLKFDFAINELDAAASRRFKELELQSPRH